MGRGVSASDDRGGGGAVEWAPEPMPTSMQVVLDAYDAQREPIIERWHALPAERWNGMLEFFGSERAASPMAWSFLFDIVHHRGQISTYLRPMGSKVPQIYGPSGDEPWRAAASIARGRRPDRGAQRARCVRRQPLIGAGLRASTVGGSQPAADRIG